MAAAAPAWDRSGCGRTLRRSCPDIPPTDASRQARRRTRCRRRRSARRRSSPSPISTFWMMGGEGLTRATEIAILNANYIARTAGSAFPGAVPQCQEAASPMNASSIPRPLKPHERRYRRRHRQTADRLRLPCPDHEFSGAGHADDRADQSESRAELDRFCDAMIAIRHEIAEIEQEAAGRSRPRRCATRRTPCTTSPTMRGPAPIPAPKAASRPAPRGPTNTGRRSAGSTTSMATAAWCARARRWRITRRRRSEATAWFPGAVQSTSRNLIF